MEFISWLKAVIMTAGTAMVPILEVKAAIPIGTAMGLPLWENFIFAVLGGLVPCPFIILFSRKMISWLKTTAILGWFGRFMERHVDQKADKVRKYSLLGLFILVAAPLPGTGVWTGSLVAALLDLRLKHAVPVILLGNIVCSLCILMITGVFVF